MNKVKGVIMTTEGQQIDVEFEQDSSLKTLQESVGGYVQAIDLLGLTMWINEEGKIENLPFNPFATILWEAEFGKTDLILGDIVLTGQPDDEGFTTSIPQSFVDLVLNPAAHKAEECSRYDEEMEKLTNE